MKKKVLSSVVLAASISVLLSPTAQAFSSAPGSSSTPTSTSSAPSASNAATAPDTTAQTTDTGAAQPQADAVVQGSNPGFSDDIKKLLNSSPNTGEVVQVNGFSNTRMHANITYTIADSAPSDAVGQRSALKLKNGKYAVPQALKSDLPAQNDPARVKEFLGVAQTYADAGTNLKWDNNKKTPLHVNEPVHKMYSKPYGLTCSSFVNLALSALKYEDTTYVKDTNTPSYSWGTNFDRSNTSEPGPWQAWRIMEWMQSHDRVAAHTPGTEDYQPGDVLFFSGTGDGKTKPGENNYMNIYHTAIYLGDNKVIHSYSSQAKNGVEVTPFHDWLKKDLTYVGRPEL